jgi:hypothetical protein
MKRANPVSLNSNCTRRGQFCVAPAPTSAVVCFGRSVICCGLNPQSFRAADGTTGRLKLIQLYFRSFKETRPSSCAVKILLLQPIANNSRSVSNQHSRCARPQRQTWGRNILLTLQIAIGVIIFTTSYLQSSQLSIARKGRRARRRGIP